MFCLINEFLDVIRNLNKQNYGNGLGYAIVSCDQKVRLPLYRVLPCELLKNLPCDHVIGTENELSFILLRLEHSGLTKYCWTERDSRCKHSKHLAAIFLIHSKVLILELEADYLFTEGLVSKA